MNLIFSKRPKTLLVIGLIIAILISVSGCTDIVGTTTTPNPPTTVKISGKASYGAVVLRNVKITLLGDSTSINTTTDNAGNYSFDSVPSGNYSLMPDKIGMLFSPPIYTVIVNSNNISSRDFRGNPASDYKIDPWGNVWDTTARSALTYAQALANCAALGGRLPTPTELYRNAKVTGNGSLVDFQKATTFGRTLKIMQLLR